MANSFANEANFKRIIIIYGLTINILNCKNRFRAKLC